MNVPIIKRTAAVLAALFIVILLIGSSYAQDVRSLERRISVLEARVKKLEKTLDRALNPAKYKGTATTQRNIVRQPVKRAPRKLTPLKTPLRAKLFNKKLKMAEPGETSDNLAFLISFENDGHVGIISFKGEIVFKDNYGDSIMSFEVDIKKPISAGKSNTWFGGLSYDSGNSSHRRILNSNIKDILLHLRIQRIAYSDGTIKEAKKD